MTSDEAAVEMMKNPDFFFKNYPIRIFGSSTAHQAGSANLRQYKVWRDKPPNDELGHQGATRGGKIFGFIKHDISSYTLEPSTMGRDHLGGESSRDLLTCSVPMVNFNSAEGGRVNLQGDVGNMQPYLVNGTSYMTTGQLSGCCFAWRESGGGLECIHVQPIGGVGTGRGNINGAALEDLMEEQAHFAFANRPLEQMGMREPLNLFGRRDYGDANATLMGVQHNGQWRLYAQTSTNSFKTILQAWRLHPGKRMQLR